ncbi:MAG: c-type cytochrome [Gallionella sp.]
MLHISSNIATALTLAVLLAAATAFAQVDDINPLKGQAEINSGADSAESIKLRSGTGDPVAGQEKSQLCQGCHGEYGNSTELLIPKLAGQYGNYIAKEIRNYQAGIRSHQIMNAMAATLSDEDVADVAAYFASQKKMKGEGSAENDDIGKNIFLHGDLSRMVLACVNCHGVNGKGLDPKISVFPVLGGQHKDYLRRQLLSFRAGERTNSPNGIMNRITNSLTDDEIDSLAGYLSER